MSKKETSLSKGKGQYKWQYCSLGGTKRVCITRGEDIAHLGELDQKMWTVLSCPVKGLELDERTLDLMNEDDIKLSLFVSRKPGAGSKILELTCERLKTEGWKNLYLWTDCDCNWQWYIKHGFTLVQEDIYEPFSSENEDYKTYIFKHKL